MPKIALRESRVIKDQFGLRRPILQLKLNQRVDPRIPIGGTPCLHDPLIRNEFHVSSADQATESRKSTARLSIYFGGHPRKRRKLLRIE